MAWNPKLVVFLNHIRLHFGSIRLQVRIAPGDVLIFRILSKYKNIRRRQRQHTHTQRAIKKANHTDIKFPDVCFHFLDFGIDMCVECYVVSEMIFGAPRSPSTKFLFSTTLHEKMFLVIPGYHFLWNLTLNKNHSGCNLGSPKIILGAIRHFNKNHFGATWDHQRSSLVQHDRLPPKMIFGDPRSPSK